MGILYYSNTNADTKGDIKMGVMEFFKILDKANVGSKMYDYEGILNSVALGLMYQSADYKTAGYKDTADKYQKNATYIYNELHDRGYYN